MGAEAAIVPILAIVGIVIFLLLIRCGRAKEMEKAVDTGRSLRIFQDKETGVCERTNEICVMDYITCNGFGVTGIGPTCGNCVFATDHACRKEEH